VSTPNPGGTGAGDFLGGVAATSGGTVFAAGQVAPATGPRHALFLQWNGSAWTRITTPNLGGGDNGLAAVAASSASNAWAAGGFDAPPNSTLALDCC
jgi:hypothetical protein